MAMNDNFTWFGIAVSVAVFLQVLILAGMYFAIKKLGGRMETLADKVEDTASVVQVRVLPMLDNAKAIQQEVKGFIESSRPKVETLVGNLSSMSSTARAGVERLDATMNDAIDRVRLQVIRGDEMLTRTMDRIEDTSEKVQHSVMSPVRQMSGIMQALSAGFGSYFNQQRRRRNGGPSDEMFI
jgi:methyl-accepting chemotaxis protein